MKAYFANSAYINTIERFVHPDGRFKSVRLNVRYGLVIHPEHGPVLIDTGYCARATSATGRSSMLRAYGQVLRPHLREAGKVERVLAQFGMTTSDVKFICVTHFHADHISALRDFPFAQFVVDDRALEQVLSNGAVANIRHGVFTELLPDDFEDRVLRLSNCPTDPEGTDIFGDGRLIAVPLPGHAAGHYGVLINADPDPIFYAVDTQWMASACRDARFAGYPARAVLDDVGAFKRSSNSVARRINEGQQVVFCHDPAPSPFDLDEQLL